VITTLNKIRANSPCSGGWSKLLKNLGKTQANLLALLCAGAFDSNDEAIEAAHGIKGDA
jgi:hypothetical protein